MSVEAFIVIGLRGRKRGEEIVTVIIPYNGDPDVKHNKNPHKP